jgi:hypothetical protein
MKTISSLFVLTMMLVGSSAVAAQAGVAKTVRSVKAKKAAATSQIQEKSEALKQAVPTEAPAVPAQVPAVPAEVPAVAQPVEAKVEPPSSETSFESKYGPQGMIGGGFVVGPKISGGVQPAVAVFGVEGKWKNLIGFGFDYGLIPTVILSNVSVGMTSYSGVVRIFPWEQAMFFGVAVGSQSWDFSITDATAGLIKVGAQTTFVAPHIGWRWTWESGFFMGMELGWQIAASNSVSGTIPAIAGATVKKDLNEALDNLGKASLPRVALLQLGWYL